jgi:hypothetical protein
MRAVPNMAVFCSSLMPGFPGTLLGTTQNTKEIILGANRADSDFPPEILRTLHRFQLKVPKKPY